MTKRVVLIGHPVAHSLSGAMQQAAFDDQGVDATYELWDRAPIDLPDAIDRAARRRLPRGERHDPPQGAGRAARRPADRGGPRDGRGQHDHARGQAPRRPQHRRAGLQGRAGQARRQPEDAADGGRPRRRRRRAGRRLRADPEGFQRIIVFNRHLHRAEALVKHFGRSAAHMELRAMPWHESIIESELAKTKVLVNATSIGLTDDVSPIPAEILPPELLVLDLIYKRTTLPARRRGGRRDGLRRRADAAPPGRGRVHAVDRPAGAARADAAKLQEAREGGCARPRASRPATRAADAGAATARARPTAPTRAGTTGDSAAGEPTGADRRTDGRHRWAGSAS